MLYKNKGIIMAEYILQMVNNRVCDSVDGFVDTFNNCREQGYIIYIHKNMKVLSIYVYANRHTDMPSITWEVDELMGDKIYSEDAYYNRTKCFETPDDTVEGIIELIKKECNLNYEL